MNGTTILSKTSIGLINWPATSNAVKVTNPKGKFIVVQKREANQTLDGFEVVPPPIFGAVVKGQFGPLAVQPKEWLKLLSETKPEPSQAAIAAATIAAAGGTAADVEHLIEKGTMKKKTKTDKAVDKAAAKARIAVTKAEVAAAKAADKAAAKAAKLALATAEKSAKPAGQPQKAATPSTSKRRKWFGFAVYSVCRAMGAKGWDIDRAIIAVKNGKIEVSESTVRKNISDGHRAVKDAAITAELTKDQWAELEKLAPAKAA